MLTITGGYDMNINLDYYKVFYTVARKGNITKAAEELMISQPAISKCIKILEEQLSGKLFVRTKKGVTLTEEGKEFYKYIEQAMELINNAEHKFSDLINLETGTIRIGISTTLTRKFLIKYLEVFHKKYPNITIEIKTELASRLFEMLRQGLVDIVILNLPYTKELNDIELFKVKEVQDAFIVGENYKDLANKKIKLESLEKYPLILQTPGAVTRDFLDKYGKDNNVTFNPQMIFSSFTLVYEFVRAGFGIGYTTIDFLEEEIKNKNVYVLDITPKIPKRGVGLAYSKKNIPSFCTKKLIEILLENKEQ